MLEFTIRSLKHHGDVQLPVCRASIAMVFALLVCIGVSPWHASAQQSNQVSVKAEIVASNLYIGDPVLLRITVDGSKSSDEPDLKSVPGCDIEFIGGGNSSQTSIIIINGRRQDNSSESYTFQYKLTPTRAGRLRIPPISIDVDGKTYQTNPIEATVSEPQAAEGFSLVLQPEKTSVYVGEPIPLHIRWYLGSTVQKVSFSMPDSDRYELITPEAAKPATAMQRNNRAVEIPFVNGSVAGQIGERELNGKIYTALSIEQILVATKPGKVTIGPLRVTCNIAVGKRQARFTDSPFDDLTVYERRVVESEPLEIDVKALPLPAPTGFSGLVGKYAVDATASPTVLNVGDPLTLIVRVSGPEPMDRVPPLELERKPEFSRAFKMSTDTAIPALTPAAAVFNITMRPRNDAIREVPAIELSYFDPTTGAYAVASSKPLSLRVQPTKEVTLDDTEEQSTDGTKIPEAEKKKSDGPPALRTDGDPFRESHLGAAEWLRSPGVIAALSLPVAACVVAAGFSARRRWHESDPAGRRRRRALRRARSRLARAGSGRAITSLHAAANVSEALRGYAADMLGQPEISLTSAECAAYFKLADPGLGSEMAGILRACDEAQFAGIEKETLAAKSLALQARTLLTSLAEKEVRA
ncbi:MAG: BatD family protein [Pyrinomonadaceae bacterium]|nr:BatD family protein [Phycisphaerales bacterium]